MIKNTTSSPVLSLQTKAGETVTVSLLWSRAGDEIVASLLAPRLLTCFEPDWVCAARPDNGVPAPRRVSLTFALR